MFDIKNLENNFTIKNDEPSKGLNDKQIKNENNFINKVEERKEKFENFKEKYGFDEKDISEEKMEKEIEKLNKVTEVFNKNLNFSVHKETGHIVIKVVDNENNIIREIPPSKILDMTARFKEILGLIFDQEY
ncbi:MAG: flagellar protein FlaG [Candidatus Muiribacteriota bacterium]|jgi:uncharacterized FlaG/YvyC family protein